MGVSYKKAEAILAAVEQAVEGVKVKHKPALKMQTAEQVAADKLINLDKKLKELGVPEIEKEVKALKGQLSLVAKDSPSNEAVSFAGEEGIVTFSPAAQKREINDPLQLIAMITGKFGKEAAASVLDINLGALAKVLSGAEIDAVSTIVAGSRTCKINPKQ